MAERRLRVGGFRSSLVNRKEISIGQNYPRLALSLTFHPVPPEIFNDVKKGQCHEIFTSVFPMYHLPYMEDDIGL
jgi:hypothetical protein